MASTLSILTFPQRWQNNQLTIRALIIPRNIDPTLDNEIAPVTPAWCNATIALQAAFAAAVACNIAACQPEDAHILCIVTLPCTGLKIQPCCGKAV